jgi:hypothetical protein
MKSYGHNQENISAEMQEFVQEDFEVGKFSVVCLIA